MNEGQDERIAGALSLLTARYGLDEAQLRQLRDLLRVLEEDDRAPTTVRSPERALDVHLADSLVALELGVVRSARTIADLGAGAGFPGLALALALVESEVFLVESQARKCAFVRDAAAAVSLQNTHVVCMRAEDWSEGLNTHDLVVARAVATQPVVLEYAAPLLCEGGALVDWRGRRDPIEEELAQGAAIELGLELSEIRHVQPFVGAREHHLHTFVKVTATPERFPRRAGMARKRPLGGAPPIETSKRAQFAEEQTPPSADRR